MFKNKINYNLVNLLLLIISSVASIVPLTGVNTSSKDAVISS